MGVFNKFLELMNLGEDDDYGDEEFYGDDEFDEFEEDKPAKKGFFNRAKSNDLDDELEAEEPVVKSSKAPRSNSKVTPMRQSSRRGSSGDICLHKPSSSEDAAEITEKLMNGNTVILNLEGLDVTVAQRITDFICGAAYALHGNVKMVSTYIFLVTPNSVEIYSDGQIQDLLDSGFSSVTIPSHY